MDFNKNIADILLLYELSMASGKTLEYKQNCESFLKLFLARKGLTSACVIQKKAEYYAARYSLPQLIGKQKVEATLLKPFLEKSAQTFATSQTPYSFEGASYKDGSYTIFNLYKQGFLVVHSNRVEPFSIKELNQLRPIMLKFSHTLEGATLFSQQKPC